MTTVSVVGKSVVLKDSSNKIIAFIPQGQPYSLTRNSGSSTYSIKVPYGTKVGEVDVMNSNLVGATEADKVASLKAMLLGGLQVTSPRTLIAHVDFADPAVLTVFFNNFEGVAPALVYDDAAGTHNIVFPDEALDFTDENIHVQFTPAEVGGNAFLGTSFADNVITIACDNANTNDYLLKGFITINYKGA